MLTIPTSFCLWAISENHDRELKLFILLKLLHRNGKTKLSHEERVIIATIMGFKDKRPLNRSINKMVQLGWIRKNDKTGYFLLKSFKNISIAEVINTKEKIRCSVDELESFNGFLGGIVFSYLHKKFWRWVKRERSVSIKGETYHSLSPSLNPKNEFAPIATTGIEALLKISRSKASDLKREAVKHEFIKVKKSFHRIEHPKEVVKELQRIGELPKNIKTKDNVCYLQSIDLVLPLKRCFL